MKAKYSRSQDLFCFTCPRHGSDLPLLTSTQSPMRQSWTTSSIGGEDKGSARPLAVLLGLKGDVDIPSHRCAVACASRAFQSSFEYEVSSATIYTHLNTDDPAILVLVLVVFALARIVSRHLRLQWGRRLANNQTSAQTSQSASQPFPQPQADRCH